MDIGITTISSKGQIVIPASLRQDLHEGEKLVIIKDDRHLIMKKVADFGNNVADDLIFAKKTEEALIRYEAGEFIEMDFDAFMKQARKW
ncbi:MAG: AbrB/MazE/SpoVT family DNA-binding domain-containing protein [Nanoarchaeota archaeon]